MRLEQRVVEMPAEALEKDIPSQDRVIKIVESKLVVEPAVENRQEEKELSVTRAQEEDSVANTNGTLILVVSLAR